MVQQASLNWHEFCDPPSMNVNCRHRVSSFCLSPSSAIASSIWVAVELGIPAWNTAYRLRFRPAHITLGNLSPYEF